MPVYDFTGKVAVVTAGASGIGKATVRAFANAGAAVLIADLDDSAGVEYADHLSAEGHQVSFVRTDTTDEREVEAMVTAAVQTFGRLDFAANIVGGMAGGDEPYRRVVDTTASGWDGTLAVNLRSTWLCLKYEIGHMRGSGPGSIVNISSLAAFVGLSDASVAYAVAKAGIIQLTKTAAATYGPEGIRVNAVAPGLTATENILAGVEAGAPLSHDHVIPRMVEPSEIADAILWLASEGSAMVTGQTLPVDGGWSAR